MPVGRTPLGPKLVNADSFAGTAEGKKRVRVVLETLTGTLPIALACEELEIKEARFHEMRREILEAAIARAEPGTPGRKPKPAPGPSVERVAQLEARVRELEVQLAVTEARSALAIAMPRVLHQPEPLVKKGGPLRATS